MNDEISVLELSEILEKNPNTVLIDVREQEEFDEVNLSGKTDSPQRIRIPLA